MIMLATFETKLKMLYVYRSRYLLEIFTARYLLETYNLVKKLVLYRHRSNRIAILSM